ncbi:alpha/beta hydrolase [Arthrobacter sp. PAMC25564]|uniref:thioesterase domain-containing protein n=1 Tax=Arthrobacter sp. PAMC25564 TaxID=2565366 RepID=UPI0010A26AAF|nr:thioesterase domain-containing protein [Arthrobacter sp. PAMC25564]QCB95680.1 alpha/beta hydrolase [Arthrobacter sp. PAMC25564]
MPPVPEAEDQGGPGSTETRWLRHAAELKRFSRRSFLTGTGSASLLAADMIFTRWVQSERRVNKILTVPDETAEKYFPNASWFLFPGYKTSWEEALWILNALRGSLTKRGQLAAVGYSNVGLDIDKIVIAVIEHVRAHKLSTLYFYGHSFGGMVATQVAARLRELHGVEASFILLDSSPFSRSDVLDQSWFEGVVFLYESGFRFPTVLRGGYELGERMLHKDERSWGQVWDQTLEQLSPIAPSSVLIQSESAYIYHFDASRYVGNLGGTRMAFIGNPKDSTVDYETARDGWRLTFAANMASDGLRTDGARPAHASPGWSPSVYRPIIEELEDELFPLPAGGGKKTAF